MGGRVDVCAAKHERKKWAGWIEWFLSVVGPHSFLWLFCSYPSSPFWPPPSPSLHPKPPKPTTCSQVIKHTEQRKLPLWEYASLVTPSPRDASVVNSHRQNFSREPGRQQTLHPQGRRQREGLAFGRVWTCWFLETRGRVGQRHAQESWQTQKGEEEKKISHVQSHFFIWQNLGFGWSPGLLAEHGWETSPGFVDLAWLWMSWFQTTF